MSFNYRKYQMKKMSQEEGLEGLDDDTPVQSTQQAEKSVSEMSQFCLSKLQELDVRKALDVAISLASMFGANEIEQKAIYEMSRDQEQDRAVLNLIHCCMSYFQKVDEVKLRQIYDILKTK